MPAPIVDSVMVWGQLAPSTVRGSVGPGHFRGFWERRIQTYNLPLCGTWQFAPSTLQSHDTCRRGTAITIYQQKLKLRGIRGCP